MKKKYWFLMLIAILLLIFVILIINSIRIIRNTQTTSSGDDWLNDGVILMKDKETGDISCFGCGKTICKDPTMFWEKIDETENRHCGDNFDVVGG